MEIRLYRKLEDLQTGKHFYCSRVECPDTFDYVSTRNVFYTIYGTDIIFVVITM